jgi:hypothetical protein
MKRLPLIVLLVLVTLVGRAQSNVLNIDLAKNFKVNDTLIVDINNIGCRVNSGDRYLIIKNDPTFTIIKFKDFNKKKFFNGKELKNSEKENFFLKNPNLLSVSTDVLDTNGFNNFFSEFEQIIYSDNKDSIRIAGTYSVLTILLNNFKFEKELPSWILKE